jgi:hypothetical protein
MIDSATPYLSSTYPLASKSKLYTDQCLSTLLSNNSFLLDVSS